MRTEKENTKKSNDRSNSSKKYDGQQNQHSDKKKYDPQTDQTKQCPEMDPPKSEEPVKSPDKKKYDVQGDTNKSTQHGSVVKSAKPEDQNLRDNDRNEDADRERHPEEQIIKQKEY